MIIWSGPMFGQTLDASVHRPELVRALRRRLGSPITPEIVAWSWLTPRDARGARRRPVVALINKVERLGIGPPAGRQPSVSCASGDRIVMPDGPAREEPVRDLHAVMLDISPCGPTPGVAVLP